MAQNNSEATLSFTCPKADIYIDTCRHGKGVFASRNFRKGEFILEFMGPEISFNEALDKGNTAQANPLQIEHDKYLDLTEPSVFINHSCSPNSGIIGDRLLIAIKPISKNQQIRFDYSTSMDEDFWTMTCSCGAKNCRGQVEDFKYLPVTVKNYYLRNNIVSSYILRRYKSYSQAKV